MKRNIGRIKFFAAITLVAFLIAAEIGLAKLFGLFHSFESLLKVLAFVFVAYLVKKVLLHAYASFFVKYNVESMVKDFVANALPQPSKYGYDFSQSKIEKWYGQTYLEDVAHDENLNVKARLCAMKNVAPIHVSEGRDWTDENIMMKIALQALHEYEKTFKINAN